jgi:hypothetical protein
MATWLWRLTLLVILLKRIAGLDLALVPTHADRAGGLGFLEKLPTAFSRHSAPHPKEKYIKLRTSSTHFGNRH